MTQIVLIGIGAGAAAALLFASLASGSLLALLLFYLSPMPILIAGIGWGNVAGLIAAVFAATCVAFVSEGDLAFMFVVAIGAPAWWLGYLALLARPAPGASPATLEWYPPGRIVLWAAVAAAVATIAVAVAAFGVDAESFYAHLKAFLETVEARIRAGSDLGTEKLFNVDLLAKVMPAIAASLSTVVLLINTSLAARIVKLSGQLHRPWPDLSAISFPPIVPVLLAVSLAGIFLPGILGIVSSIFAGCLTMAFAVLGFAVLHVVTRRNASRPLILVCVYTVVIIFTWPVIILALLGLADTALDLRGRAARTRGPPTTLH